MSLQNTWHHRKVADTAAKACFICYKPSNSVLITPDNKDFFYICPAHLKDRNFCSAVVDTAGAEAKVKEALQQRKKEKEKEKKGEESKEKNGEEKKDADKDKGKDKDARSDEKERDDKIESLKKQEKGQGNTPTDDSDSSRVFSLHKNFYQMRIDRLRNVEMAKRNRQRLQDPSLFPSVPSGGL
ncbi:AAA-ATPase Vps4-associated 1 family protein [Aspergillus glaucus CBS 516.65]|uniref:DUF1742-domain-containing protein n=1 Tax=Aspergillus glaucus CBS 516.65 TaxID=1160497 RepID=A0A1L9VT48_ASPGL|nr:hypothetical protein ASPGLDRAFT_1121476 [Aspergillus glaucus CBS 516.65]OJJ87062.1 hypothetical protein ASPGLDRAFT_1121476 [Aspergillus glaucus CBS 516.65]